LTDAGKDYFLSCKSALQSLREGEDLLENVLRSRGMKARAFVRKAERGQEDQSRVLEYFKHWGSEFCC
jgi:hypothetical protein